MGRQLDASTLDLAALHYAREFIGPDISHPHGGHLIGGREFMLTSMFGFTFKDEFEYLYAKICKNLGPDSLKDFEREAKDRFTPRDDKVFADFLADKLAIDVNGEHLDGKIGTTIVGGRAMGDTMVTVESPDSVLRRRRLGLGKETLGPQDMTHQLARVTWNVYAGEELERAAGSDAPDLFPIAGGALDTRVANVNVLAGANALVDLLDGGSLGAVIQGRTTPRPADPDAAVSGTNLFTLTCSVTAFGAATDAAPGALKTANAITDDTSADATGTLAYLRASSSNVADTPLVDQIDGEAGTAGADFNFNTLAIVSGAVVSMTSWTITMPE